MKIRLDLLTAFTFTILLLSIIFWNRLIRVRLPKDLTQYANYNISIYIIIFLTILFATLTLYNFLKYLRIIPNENSRLSKLLFKFFEFLEQYSWVKRSTEFFDANILKGPEKVYEYLYERVDIRRIVSKLQALCVYHLVEIEFIYLFVFVILRLSVAATFFLEIIMVKYIYYFYKLLILLLIPLIVKFILYFINSNATKNIDSFDELFDITLNEETNTVVIKDRPITDPEDLEQQQKSDQEYVARLWDFYQDVYRYVYYFNLLIDKDKNLVNTIYYGLMFIGFFFYLLTLLGLY